MTRKSLHTLLDNVDLAFARNDVKAAKDYLVAYQMSRSVDHMMGRSRDAEDETDQRSHRQWLSLSAVNG